MSTTSLGSKSKLSNTSRGLLAVVMLGLIFYPEDEGDMFLRNVRLSPKYSAIRPRRPDLVAAVGTADPASVFYLL
jgi:hypothetical protein